MDCDDVFAQISDFIDADMRDELCREIKAHLKHCRGCEVRVDEVRKTILLFREGSPASREIPIHALDGLQQMLAAEYKKP